MALDDPAVFKCSQPFLYAPARPSHNFILARFRTFDLHAHIPIEKKTIWPAWPSNMARVGAANELFCGCPPRIHTCPTKLVALKKANRHARGCKPRSQRWASLASPDDD